MINKKYKLKLNKLLVPIIGGIIIFSLTGCLPKEEEVLAPLLKEPEKIEYNAIEVKKGNIAKEIRGSGSFVSINQSSPYFTYRGGRLKVIHVESGQIVKKGDLLVELQTDGLEAQIKQQEIALQRVKITGNQSTGNAQRNMEIAGMKLQDLQDQYDRLKSDNDADAKDIIQNLEKEIKIQKIIYAGVVEDYNAVMTTVGLDMKIAEYQLDNLKLELEKTKLISPVSGRITYIKEVNIGDYIETYTSIITIADTKNLLLKCSSNDLSSFDIGMKVEVEISDKIFEGEVVMIPRSLPRDADESLKNSVFVKVRDIPGEVEIGDLARIKLTLEKKENVIVISRDLVSSYMSRKTVKVLKDGIKEDRYVETGIETPTEVEIVKGLSVGEKIIK